MTTKRLLLPLCLLLSAFSLCAQSLSGRVVDRDGLPVAAARVAVEGTSLFALTDDEGFFELSGPPPPPLVIIVSSDDFQSRSLPISVPPQEALVITLEPISVDLGEVEVFAERDEIKASKRLDRETVAGTSTGGDPFALVDRVPEVVDAANPALENDMQAARLELTEAFDVPVLKLSSPYHYRGLPYYSNAFFLERIIPLFFNSYSHTGSMLSSIVPADILDGMDSFGNGRDPSLGPGNGLISSFSISEPDKERVHWTLYLSSLALSGSIGIPLFEGAGGLTLSLRKSLYEWTWIPLAVALNDIYQYFPIPGVGDDLLLGLRVAPGNVDAYAHFFWEPDKHNRLQVDFVDATGYVDFLYKVYSANGYQHLRYFDLTHQSGLGASWTYDPGKEWSLKADAHDIISWLRTTQGQSQIGGESWETTYSYPLNDLGGGFSGRYSPFDDLVVSAGLGGRWIRGWYERTREADPVFYPGTVAESISRDYGLDTGEANAFAKADWILGDFELEPSLRYDWFPVIGSGSWIGDSRLSPMLQAYWYPAEKQRLRIGGGMRYDRFDYFTRNVFVAEQNLLVNQGGAVVIDDDYIQKKPSRLLVAETEYSIELKENAYSLGAYFCYIDELSGFDYQTYYAESDALYFSLLMTPGYAAALQGAGLKKADALWSAGGSADMAFRLQKSTLDVLYSLGVTRYHVDRNDDGSLEWIVPMSDVTHTLKLFWHWEPTKSFSLDCTLKTLFGIPASLHRVDSVETYPETGYTAMAFSEIPYSQYQFHDYMPRFSLDFKAILKTDSDPVIEFYADVARLISFPRYAEPAVARTGFEEKSVSDRKYDWNPFDWASLLFMKLDLGCRLRY